MNSDSSWILSPYSFAEKSSNKARGQIFPPFFAVFTFVADETRNVPRAPPRRPLREKRDAGQAGERKERGAACLSFRRYGAPPTYACTPCMRRALAPATPNNARWNSTRDDHHALVRTAKRLTNRRGDSIGPREWKEGGGRPSLATAFLARVPSAVRAVWWSPWCLDPSRKTKLRRRQDEGKTKVRRK